MKTCTKCGVEKPADSFPWRTANGRRMQRATCSDCYNANQRAWNAKNAHRYVELKKRYYEENRDKYLLLAKQQRDKEGEARLEYMRRWREENPSYSKTRYARAGHKCCAYVSKRKAAKLCATPAWAEQSGIEAVYAEAKRLQNETGLKHHVDHIVPLQSPAVCGLHCEDNLRVLRAEENLRKKNTHWPDMW